MKARRSKVQDHLWLHSKVKVSLALKKRAGGRFLHMKSFKDNQNIKL